MFVGCSEPPFLAVIAIKLACGRSGLYPGHVTHVIPGRGLPPPDKADSYKTSSDVDATLNPKSKQISTLRSIYGHTVVKVFDYLDPFGEIMHYLVCLSYIWNSY